MGYQPRIRSRTSSRGYKTPRREKTKSQERKYRSKGSSNWNENHVKTIEEVVEKILGQLHTLGDQRFAYSPYSEHLDRWLTNLKDVLSQLESNPNLSTDEQFAKESSQILLNVELQLKERRRKEASYDEVVKDLSDRKTLLKQIDEENAVKAREIEERENNEMRRLRSNISSLKAELDEITHMKTGLFRGISKKTKAQKEAEAVQRLNAAQEELTLAEQNFTAEQERLSEGYERKKQPIIEQISSRQKEVDNLEIDGSLEDRRVACKALTDAINALVQRKKTTSSSEV